MPISPSRVHLDDLGRGFPTGRERHDLRRFVRVDGPGAHTAAGAGRRRCAVLRPGEDCALRATARLQQLDAYGAACRGGPTRKWLVWTLLSVSRQCVLERA